MDPKPQGVWFRFGFIHQKMVIITYLMLAVAAVVIFPSAAYVNISLSSPYMSAKVFMPMESEGFTNDRFYIGSRFEHGSMIGDFLIGNDREVYGRGLWREPHNPNWPESGVGLASEFGCGHDGVACVGRGDIYNGVLGYDTAKAGEPFLKIGVGALIKGSCPACSWKDDDVYKFNSPYKFFRPPSWKVLSSPGPNEVTIYSEEKLGEFGYGITKTTRLDGNVLTVRSLLTNLGKKQFATPWYSHHFFTGDREPIGPGYVLNLGLSEYGLPNQRPLFKQPGLGSWAGDINDYFDITMASDGSISMTMKRAIPEGVKLKADFLDENTQTLTDGSFNVHAPNGISVHERIPELQTQSRNPFIYAYSVYAERGALCPEPMLLLYLQPAETTFWTQNLRFSSSNRSPGVKEYVFFLPMFSAKAWEIPFHLSSGFLLMLVAASFGVIVSSLKRSTGSRRRDGYSAIPHQQNMQEDGDTLSPA
jgi:hypothetical protein